MPAPVLDLLKSAIEGCGGVENIYNLTLRCGRQGFRVSKQVHKGKSQEEPNHTTLTHNASVGGGKLFSRISYTQDPEFVKNIREAKQQFNVKLVKQF